MSKAFKTRRLWIGIILFFALITILTFEPFEYYSVIRSLISSPIWAISFVLFFWLLIVHVFISKKPAKRMFWLQIEHIWILIAFLGVLALIDENRRQYFKSELGTLEIWVNNDLNAAIRFLNMDAHCGHYQNTGIFNEDEFLLRQQRQESICLWTIQMSEYLQRASNKIELDELELTQLKIDNPSKEWIYNEVSRHIQRVNQYISRQQFLNKELEVTTFREIYNTIGLILVLIAFILRLTVLTVKIRIEKQDRIGKD